MQTSSSPTPAAAIARRAAARRWPLVLAATALAVGCATRIHYDPTSLKHATDLKTESLTLISKAGDVPTAHTAEIDTLRTKVTAAYEYERTKGQANAITVKQWEILQDPNGNLIGGFLTKWQTEGVGQSPAFIQGTSKNVGDAFDVIMAQENSKAKD